MDLKESYQRFLPIAQMVAREHYIYLPQDMREDILSTAQLNVFEFCNLVLPTLDPQRGGDFEASKCYEYVYKRVHKVYTTEKAAYYNLISLNSKNKTNAGEEFGELQDTLKSKEPAAQYILEKKTSKTELRKLFARLQKEDVLIFNSYIKDIHLSEKDIAKIHNISEKQVNKIVKDILKEIYDEVGEFEYERYYRAVSKAKKARFIKILKENVGFLSNRERSLLKNKYILKMTEITASQTAGYNGPNNSARVISKLKILAGEDCKEKTDLIKYIKRRKKLEKLIAFIRKDEQCNAFLSSLTEKRRDIFTRHYFNKETFDSIARSYNCVPTNIETYCVIILKNLKDFIAADEQGKKDILNSLQRTKNQKIQNVCHSIRAEVAEFISFDNYEEILEKLPKRDQYIIKNHLILGEPAEKIARGINLTKMGVLRRADTLAKLLPLFIHGTETEKTRAFQRLSINRWFKHKIKDNIRTFVERDDYDELLECFPIIDRIIIQDYFIDGYRSKDVAKKIGFGKSGLNFRADKISKRIDILNDGTPEEKTACLALIKRDKLTMDKKSFTAQEVKIDRGEALQKLETPRFNIKEEDELKMFVKNTGFEETLKLFPLIDQILFKTYFIERQSPKTIAEQIGYDKTGLYYRTGIISKRIQTLNNGTEEEKEICFGSIKKDKLRMDKKLANLKEK